MKKTVILLSLALVFAFGCKQEEFVKDSEPERIKVVDTTKISHKCYDTIRNTIYDTIRNLVTDTIILTHYDTLRTTTSDTLYIIGSDTVSTQFTNTTVTTITKYDTIQVAIYDTIHITITPDPIPACAYWVKYVTNPSANKVDSIIVAIGATITLPSE